MGTGVCVGTGAFLGRGACVGTGGNGGLRGNTSPFFTVEMWHRRVFAKIEGVVSDGWGIAADEGVSDKSRDGGRVLMGGRYYIQRLQETENDLEKSFRRMLKTAVVLHEDSTSVRKHPHDKDPGPHEKRPHLPLFAEGLVQIERDRKCQPPHR